MLVSTHWLQDFIHEELPAAPEIVQALTMHSFEIEDVYEIGLRYPGLLVGRIKRIEAHPNADRLQVAYVDLGEDEFQQIVCGAANVAEDQLVPVATVGAVLPNGTHIEAATLRDVRSNGMICSKAELGLVDEADGIWSLNDDLRADTDVQPGAPIDGLLLGDGGTALGSIDTVIDVDVLPNRASDCLSHRGIAKELAVIFDLTFQEPDAALGQVGGTELSIDIADDDLCRRYTGAYLTDVQVTTSPQWLQDRLRAIGQRPINNIVDATNYVMFSLGQPLHAFDADTLTYREGYAITVREAKAGETLTTLDDEQRTLPTGAIVITDAGSDTPIAIGGIMGGSKTQVSEGTTNIILEAATFGQHRIRTTAQQLKLATDSSKRFENEITPQMTERAIAAVIGLLKETAASEETQVVSIVDTYPRPRDIPTVEVSVEQINKLLGTQIEEATAQKILERLGCDVCVEGGVFEVKAPSERLDLNQPVDIIEEVGRIHGYEHIGEQELPDRADEAVRMDPIVYYAHLVRDKLIERGYSELETYALTESGEVEIENPLTNDKKYYRASLAPGLTRSLEENHRRVDQFGTASTKLFEIGNIYTNNEEHTQLALAMRHTKNADEKTTLEDELQALGEAIGIEIAKGAVYSGEVAIIELDTLIPNEVPSDAPTLADLARDITFRPISPFPYLLRDVSVWVPVDTTDEQVAAVIDDNANEWLTNRYLFDTYERDEQISYAYRLVFQSHERTLTDEEVNAVMEKIYTALSANEDWEIR